MRWISSIAWIEASNSSRPAWIFGSIAAVATPARLAIASPPASLLLERTSAISAGKSGARAASISAAMLEPRPEIRIAVRTRRVTTPPRRSLRQARFARAVTEPILAGERPASASARIVCASLCAEAKTTIPKPQLKVRSISACADAADLGEPAEYSRRREGGEVEFDAEVVGQHARQIVGKAAAGDMGERANARRGLQRGEQRLHVEPGRGQQRLGQRASRQERRRRLPGEAASARRCGAPAKSRWNGRPRTAGR